MVTWIEGDRRGRHIIVANTHIIMEGHYNKTFSKVLPVVMQRSAGKADGKLVQSLVREKLS